METQIENGYSSDTDRSLYFKIGELLMVFLPPVIIVPLMTSWAGDDPLRSMGVVGAVNIIMMIMVWTGLKLRGESPADLGLTFGAISMKESLRVFGLSVLVALLGFAAFLSGGVIMAGVGSIPEAADLSIYTYMRDNLGMLFFTLGSVYIVSSFGEEVIYRAFLISRISQFGGGTTLAVVLSSVIFGLIHYAWGPMGMIQTGLMGLVMGIFYVKLKKRLWILILAHAYMDTVLMVQMYLASN